MHIYICICIYIYMHIYIYIYRERERECVCVYSYTLPGCPGKRMMAIMNRSGALRSASPQQIKNKPHTCEWFNVRYSVPAK